MVIWVFQAVERLGIGKSANILPADLLDQIWALSVKHCSFRTTVGTGKSFALITLKWSLTDGDLGVPSSGKVGHWEECQHFTSKSAGPNVGTVSETMLIQDNRWHRELIYSVNIKMEFVRL